MAQHPDPRMGRLVVPALQVDRVRTENLQLPPLDLSAQHPDHPAVLVLEKLPHGSRKDQHRRSCMAEHQHLHLPVQFLAVSLVIFAIHERQYLTSPAVVPNFVHTSLPSLVASLLATAGALLLWHFRRRTFMPGKLPHPSMFAAIPLIILLSLAKLDAQQTNPTITGTVTTATGAAIPNAKVTAKNLTTGDTTSAQSDATGHFHFDALPPADYEISASADGLATQASKVTV